jgi:hypothetical protein
MLSSGNSRLDPSSVESDGEVIVMLMKINDRYNTLSEAISIIDPSGTLVPGTKEHNWLTESILTWMNEMASEEVLKKAASARHMLKLIVHTVP